MFRRIFTSRVKFYLRSREYIFWMLVFPIILSTLFKFAFANILSGEQMETIDVAIVTDGVAEDSTQLTVYKEVFSADTFQTAYLTEKEAKAQLKAEKIDGYILLSEPKLVVDGKGYAQTVLKEVIDYINQEMSAITKIYIANQGEVSQEFTAAIQETKSYITDLKVSNQEPNTIVVYFYTVLAMTAFFAASGGILEVMSIQANQSSVALRVNLAPVSKLQVFAPSALAAEVLQFGVMVIVILYIRFVLGIDFGNRYGLILLNTFVGSICGMAFGAMIGAIVKKNENFKTGVCMGFTMFCCFLAGMMGSDIKYMIKKAVPLVDRLNPVNLITEGYYKLYYYDALGSFWQNIAILLVMTGICLGITLGILRRQRYDSL